MRNKGIRGEHHRDTAKVLLTAVQIRRRVRLLAGRISRDYSGKRLIVVSVLKGSVIFFADLVRNLSINCSVDFISVSSYAGSRARGRVRLVSDLREDPAGKDVLLVEDIADSGYTLAYLQKNLRARQPASLKTCVLLDKKSARKVSVKIDYRAFIIPDEFVVGYGLDYQEQYRGLPFIGVLNPEIIGKNAGKKKKK
jgi:hypoxanthine phosphoribosyltransferase